MLSLFEISLYSLFMVCKLTRKGFLIKTRDFFQRLVLLIQMHPDFQKKIKMTLHLVFFLKGAHEESLHDVMLKKMMSPDSRR